MKGGRLVADSSSLEGSRLGRYRLRFRIAQGGMASVYLAQLEGTHGFERWVAVKVVHPHLTEQRRFANMLLDEARVAAKIHHPNVCAMLDFGEQDGVLFLVMEYLHGESFSSTIRRAWKATGRVEPWLAARVTLDAAMGLQAAHDLDLGVVHRDVSPQNIQVLYQGQSKVVDFGIARARGRLTSTDVGEVKGKLSYMAPEQIRSQPVDHRADVWALGVVLWEATTGKRLFRTDAHGSTVLNVVDMAVPRPTRMFADYPPALEAAILGALTRDPTKRTQSAGKLAEQLEEYLYASGRPAGANQVAAWMKAHFADKLDKRDAILRDATSDVGGPVPEIELESESSIASRVRGTDSSARAEAIPVALPDTQADVVLPEARTGLAVPPPQDDDDDGATVIADPPVMAEAVAPPPVMAGLERDPRDFEALTSPDAPAATVRSPSLPEMERAARRSQPSRPYAGPPPPPRAMPPAPAVATPNASATSTGRHAPVDGSASPRPPPIATPFSPTARPEGSVEPAVIFGAIGVIGFLLLLIAIAVVLAVTSSDSAPETDTDATTESAHSQ